jgi:hypothetical protein
MRADLNYSNNSGRFLLSVSVAALALASSANAADYTAGTDQQLRDAIAAANASPDASSTIMLTGSFTVTAAYLPVPAKAITINTEGFTLTGRPGTATGALQFTSTGGNIVTINGNLAGGTGIPGTTTGGYGLWVQTDGGSSFVNNGSIAAAMALQPAAEAAQVPERGRAPSLTTARYRAVKGAASYREGSASNSSTRT